MMENRIFDFKGKSQEGQNEMKAGIYPKNNRSKFSRVEAAHKWIHT